MAYSVQLLTVQINTAMHRDEQRTLTRGCPFACLNGSYADTLALLVVAMNGYYVDGFVSIRLIGFACEYF